MGVCGTALRLVIHRVRTNGHTQSCPRKVNKTRLLPFAFADDAAATAPGFQKIQPQKRQRHWETEKKIAGAYAGTGVCCELLLAPAIAGIGEDLVRSRRQGEMRGIV